MFKLNGSAIGVSADLAAHGDSTPLEARGWLQASPEWTVAYRGRVGADEAERPALARDIAAKALGPNAGSGHSGRFAWAVGHAGSGVVTAARDASGLEPLYFKASPEQITVADSVEAFAPDSNWSAEYLMKFITSRGQPAAGTIRDGVREVPSGAVLRWRREGLEVERQSDRTASRLDGIGKTLRDVVPEFLELATEAVRREVDEDGRTWILLSGGLDSSAIVALACRGRSDCGIGGAISFRESTGNGDESEYAKAVTSAAGLKLEFLDDYGPWDTDGTPPPLTDRPTRDYPFYARNRAVSLIVTAAGGSSLLTGAGPDAYLPYTIAHAPDLIWRGSFALAWRELYKWSLVSRRTLSEVVWREGLWPLISRTAGARRSIENTNVPGWFTPRARRDWDLKSEMVQALTPGAPRGTYYESDVAAVLDMIAECIGAAFGVPGVEMRHPLMDPELVAWCRSLPFDCRTDGTWPKPVLRTAMRGLMPELVRMRSTKGLLATRIYKAMREKNALLKELLRSPVLGDMGLIEPKQVIAALDEFSRTDSDDAPYLYALLSLETWLSRRTGRCVV